MILKIHAHDSKDLPIDYAFSPNSIDRPGIFNPLAQLLMSGCLQFRWLNMAVNKLSHSS